MLGQRSNDDVVGDVIESALRLAQEDVWKRMNGCVKGDLAINICGSSAWIFEASKNCGGRYPGLKVNEGNYGLHYSLPRITTANWR